MSAKLVLVALWMSFGMALVVPFGTYGAEDPGTKVVDTSCFLQLAGTETVVSQYDVKESGGTVKVPYCPKWCTRKVRTCTERLADGKCKLWQWETETYCCG